METSTLEQMIGLDIAKSVFQAHVEDGQGRVLAQRRLRRAEVEKFFARQPRSLIGIEACGSAHYWARRLSGLGHEVRLIPAAYVRPYVKRNKTDARDAAAICEALGKEGMFFVRIKSAEQQAARGLERTRELLVRQHTQLMNSLRGQLAEHGIIAAQGRRGLAVLKEAVLGQDERLPELLVPALMMLISQAERLDEAVRALEKQIAGRAKADPVMRRLATIPGVGPILAHAIVSAVGDGRQFRSGRDFAAWVGLTPLVHATAGKCRTKGISRAGDTRLRSLFTLGASTVMRHVRTRTDRASEWQRGILARRPVKVAVVAQAAKTARIAWAMLQSGEVYQPLRPRAVA